MEGKSGEQRCSRAGRNLPLAPDTTLSGRSSPRGIRHGERRGSIPWPGDSAPGLNARKGAGDLSVGEASLEVRAHQAPVGVPDDDGQQPR